MSSGVKKKYKATTDSKHNLPVAENILNRDFKSGKQDKKYVSDITYLWTDEGWLYLAAILDLYDGAIVGWSMNERMTKEIVINALREACMRRNPEEGLILHSDRGSQYCSKEYQKEIIQRIGYILDHIKLKYIAEEYQHTQVQYIQATLLAMKVLVKKFYERQ